MTRVHIRADRYAVSARRRRLCCTSNGPKLAIKACGFHRGPVTMMYGSASGRSSTSEMVRQSNDSWLRSRALRSRFNSHLVAWKNMNDAHAGGIMSNDGTGIRWTYPLLVELGKRCGASKSYRQYRQANTPRSYATTQGSLIPDQL